MTIVIAAKTGNGLFVMSDRFVGHEDLCLATNEPKFFERDGVFIGYAGHYSFISRLRYDLDISDIDYDDPTHKLWEVSKAVKELRTDDEEQYEVILYTKNVLATSSHLGELITTDIAFIGSGSYYAMGAWYALNMAYESSILSANGTRELVEMAFQAAVKYDPLCGGGEYKTTIPTYNNIETSISHIGITNTTSTRWKQL